MKPLPPLEKKKKEKSFCSLQRTTSFLLASGFLHSQKASELATVTVDQVFRLTDVLGHLVNALTMAVILSCTNCVGPGR